MNSESPITQMAADASRQGKDNQSRTVLVVLAVLWALLLVGGLVFVWNAYFQQKDTAQTLAQQIAFACKSGDFGPGISPANEEAMCSNAQKVIKDQQPTQGIQGPSGPQGVQGIPGPRGLQGLPGPQGLRGLMGKGGQDGVVGPVGPPGPQGQTGPQGDQGPAGDKGATGETGAQGPPGVVNITTVGCEGPIIHSIGAAYDPESQTVTITCN